MHKRILIISLLAFVIAACTTHRHGKSNPRNVKIKPSIVLEAEHKRGKIVIITHPPASGRKCWPHQRHWHCQSQ